MFYQQFFPGLFLFIIFQVLAAEGQQCNASFATTCSSLSGVIDGGRCFFLANAGGTWSSAWTVCEQAGATLAQIQTTSELKKIYSMTTNTWQSESDVWIALQRDNSVTGTPYSIVYGATFWYDSASSPNLAMPVENTFLRFHETDDDDKGSEYCFVIHTFNNTDGLFYDQQCGDWYCPLCQITTQCQSYTLYNICLTETPIESTKVSQPQDCANLCSARSWCRSFNVIDSCLSQSFTCELFTWAASESCPNCPNSSPATGTQCSYYSYDP